MTNLPLNALRAFEAAARLNSFSEAAIELCVTQSAVSHQIKRLENWLEAPLFSRQGNSLNLLPQGQELADTLTLSLGRIAQVCNTIQTQHKNLPLVIAAIPSIAAIWLVPRLDAFQRAHPNIDIKIEYALHGSRVNFKDVDFAFTFSKEAPSEINTCSDTYLSGKCCAVCNPTIAATSDIMALDPMKMSSVGFLHDTDTSAWEAWFEKANIPMPNLENGPTYQDFNLLRAAAIAGQGIALCPEAMIQKDLENGRLIKLSEITVQDEFYYHIIKSDIRRPSNDKTSDIFEDWVLSLKNT